MVDATDQANLDRTWLFQEIEAVNRTIKISNNSGTCISLGKNKDTSVIKIRPIVEIGKERLNSTFRLDDSLSKKNFLVKENTRDYVARINLVTPEQSTKCQNMSTSSSENELPLP